jgi:hypothetical protein
MCAAVEPGWGNESPPVSYPIRQSPFPLSGDDGDGLRWRGGGRPPDHREDADGDTTVWFGPPPAAETVSHTPHPHDCLHRLRSPTPSPPRRRSPVVSPPQQHRWGC